MINSLLSSLLLANLLFTPIRTPIISPRDEDKTPETLEKERFRRKCFEDLSIALQDKFGFEVEPTGWPSNQPEISFISFSTYYPAVESQEEARKLLVEAVSFILSYINDSPEIVPYLKEYPITSKEMFFNIMFVENLMSSKGWGSVNLSRGTVNYGYVYGKIKVPSETFEEAKAKVAASSR